MKKKNVVTSILFFLVAIFFCPQSSSAHVSKITVDKGIIDLTSASGQDAEFHFSLRNDSDESQKIQLSANDIMIGDDNMLEPIDVPGGPSRLVSFGENDFMIEPHKIKTVSGVIKFSQEKEEASFYNMMVMVSFLSAEKKEILDGPQISGKIGIHVFAKIGGNHNAGGKIEKVFLPKILNQDNEIRVSYINTGDVYFIPQSDVRIKNFIGGSEQEAFLDKHFVFPGKKVVFSGKRMENISPWGLFRIRTRFVDGNGNASTADSYALGYLFPVGLIAAMLGFFLAGIFILRKRNQIKVEMMEKN